MKVLDEFDTVRKVALGSQWRMYRRSYSRENLCRENPDEPM
jgi:hypothetical protein